MKDDPLLPFTEAIDGYRSAVMDLVIGLGRLQEIHALRHEELTGRLDKIEGALGIEQETNNG